MQSAISFFERIFESLPVWPVSITLVVLSAGISFVILWMCGNLKITYGLQTGFTRKAFHFLIFGLSSIIQYRFGLSILCLFGTGVSLTIFLVLAAPGPGLSILYNAVAREKDQPHSARYVVIPYLSTLVGGLLTNIVFGNAAIIGYLVCGLGDASGEVFGLLFGKHRYRAPSLGRDTVSYKSIEGSLAVFIFSVIGCAAGAIMMGTRVTGWMIGVSLIVGVISTGIEAISIKGIDNLTMQIIPTWVFVMLI